MARRAGADLLAAQFAADVARIALEGFLHGRFHVYLHGEMHAAAQVEAEKHWVGLDFGHPFGAVGQKIERGDVAFAQRVFNHIACFELGFGIFKAHFERIVGDKHAVGGDVGSLQGGGNAVFGLLVDDDGLAVGGNLHSRGFAKQIGQRINGGQNQRGGNQQVFPERIAVHVKPSLYKDKQPQQKMRRLGAGAQIRRLVCWQWRCVLLQPPRLWRFPQKKTARLRR